MTPPIPNINIHIHEIEVKKIGIMQLSTKSTRV